MPPKRGQNYTERVNKRRRAADSSATTDSVMQPHPSRLQPVQLQEPSNAARATPQLTLSAEVLAALTNSISAAVSEALLTVAQPLQPATTAAATAFPVAHPSTSAAAAAVPEVQFVPDPISISSAEVVNRDSSVVEANPTTPNADQSLLNTVNNAVQQVTSSLLPSAAPQRLQIQLFPLSAHTLALFIAFLAEKNYAASTVSSYISALSFPHRLASVPDPTKSEMIRLALRGYSKMNPSRDTRLPISLPILENIILACEHTKSSLYSKKLTQAMYALAFFAALRVGEITYRGNLPGQNIISIGQIAFMETREGTVTALKLTLRNYKHSDSSSPVDIFIYRERPVCPVYLLSEYINIRGQFPGPLFCWPDASPITRSFFVTALKEDLQFCDLDISHYKTHSFRIGAASWAAAKGMSDTQIRDFGRWKSNAFLRYIRTSTMGSQSAFQA
ncbi:unnamed protein product [Porites lobata]|uniref:Tyr recombinase domain-containing protein n=1 Tax=Porites lobata TaxID=104759 RepID=A0ABN8PLK0_9CNID|nr:unnamed protein product [Porites lobata]